MPTRAALFPQLILRRRIPRGGDCLRTCAGGKHNLFTSVGDSQADTFRRAKCPPITATRWMESAAWSYFAA